MLTKEDLAVLQFPFKAAEHEFLQSKAYITEGAITDRIEQVDPSWKLEQISLFNRADSNQVVCTMRLTINDVWRDGVGMSVITKLKSGTGEANEAEKSAATDALKRAARLFGIGRYLLDLPSNVKDVTSLRNYLIDTYAAVPDPLEDTVPPPAAAAQAGEPPKVTPPADDWEANERRKAVTALDNEELMVYSTHYNPLHNGKGFPRWEAMARIADGVSVPLVVWTEHETLIKKAGYEWPRDAEDLAIPVITEMVGSERRIKAVKALDDSWMLFEPKIAQKGAVDGNNGNPDEFPVWVFDKVMLLTKLGKDQFACKIPYEERGATVDKMHRENEFAKVSGLDGAVEMVVSRLKAHRKDKVA